MGDRLYKLETVMASMLERLEGLFVAPRRVGIIIIAPDDPGHTMTISYGSLLPSDIRSLAASNLLMSDDDLDGVTRG